MKLIRYDTERHTIEATEYGRIASHYYINCETMERICYYLRVQEGNQDEDFWSTDDNLIGVVA